VNENPTSSIPINQFRLWEKLKQKRSLISFEIELTNRCNNNCRHCYINLPANDAVAKKKELSGDKLKEIIDEAVSLGALWCLITGGEPLLRQDFFDIYLYLKKKGLLVAVFTNATLITKKHVNLFKKYPPRNIEVTVYGVNRETYEKVTRTPGSFTAFTRGLDYLVDGGVNLRLKAMALRSNFHDLGKIASFCRGKTAAQFRFDPFLHLRFDGNPDRNMEIVSERLTPEEIVALERADPERLNALKKDCDKLIVPYFSQTADNTLFHCGAGNSSFTLSSEGLLRLCSSLWNRECVRDLKKESLATAWHDIVPEVKGIQSQRDSFLANCRICPIINLCMWCPAHADLETGKMDQKVDYFCRVAHARAEAFGKNSDNI